MKEIGCKAFVLIQNRHNPKVYERSIECVLIGYEPNAKSYRCYHRPTRQVISSYHVCFLESHDGHPLPPLANPQQSDPTELSTATQGDDDDDVTNNDEISSTAINWTNTSISGA